MDALHSITNIVSNAEFPGRWVRVGAPMLVNEVAYWTPYDQCHYRRGERLARRWADNGSVLR